MKGDLRRKWKALKLRCNALQAWKKVRDTSKKQACISLGVRGESCVVLMRWILCGFVVPSQGIGGMIEVVQCRVSESSPTFETTLIDFVFLRRRIYINTICHSTLYHALAYPLNFRASNKENYNLHNPQNFQNHYNLIYHPLSKKQ